jgi:hypothetical protein
MAGTPNREIQPANRALLQSAAVIEESGIASSHREVLSITVNRYVWLRVGEAAVRYWNGDCLELDMSVDLALLAEQAGLRS